MKFIKLEILNLASLDKQGGETINFTEGALGNSTIFSIVGSTGSGKSTILDAICLALYGRAPRYKKNGKKDSQKMQIFGELQGDEKNRIAPTDPRNILTHGKKDGYSKLTFLANNGGVYRAEWSVHKKVKDYDKELTSLYKITTKDGEVAEEVGVWEELPTIIGLDYEQFLRTVLIAQGSFSNFLTAKENERYELLEKLVGCEELYTSIARRIKHKKDEAEKEYNKIEAEYSAKKDGLIADEELPAVKAKIAELEEAEKKVKAELQKVTEAIAWYNLNDKFIHNIEVYAEAEKAAAKAVEDAKETMARLSLHDTTLPAVDLYKEMVTARTEMEVQQQNLKGIEESIAKISTQIEEEGKVLENLKAKEIEATKLLEQQKPHINKARTIKAELGAVETDVREKAKVHRACEDMKKKADKDVADNAEAIAKDKIAFEKKSTELTELQNDIEKRKSELAAEVAKLTEAFDAENNKLAEQDATTLQDTKSKAEAKLRDLDDAIRMLGNIADRGSKIGDNSKKAESLKQRNSAIDAELQQLTIDALAAEVEIMRKVHTLMTSENWARNRQYLTDGKPCPLCGATHHPYKDDGVLAPDISDYQQLLQSKENQLKEQTRKQTVLGKERSANEGTIKALEAANADLEKELEKLSAEWSVIRAKHVEWTDDKEMLEALLPNTRREVDDATKALAEYNKLVKTVEAMRKAKEKAEQNQQEYNKIADAKLRKAEQAKINAETELKTEMGKSNNLLMQQTEKKKALADALTALELAKKERADKAAALKVELGDKDPDAYETELTNASKAADAAVEKKEKEINALRETCNGFEGQRKTTNEVIKAKEQSMKKSGEALTGWLADYQSKNGVSISADTIAALYNSKENWEAIRLQQKVLDDALTKAQTTLRNEQKEQSEHLTKKPETEKDELLTRENELKQWSAQELMAEKARMLRHEDAKKQIGAMIDQMKSVEQMKNEWTEITDAIGSDGKTLRQIAQCYTLRFLIEHANVEIRKFNSRYELQQVKNSLGIRVIDHDRADDVRDTTSLSGGETFIVSLGLALGLSALSSRNISFENLFIDEGFGTLDPDTLSTVIDSLAMLQSSQGKKVGVISHTDTMSERITTQIRIIKNGNSGSSHIEIYP